MLNRYNGNVGKYIGGYVYFHRQYLSEIPQGDIIQWVMANTADITDEYNIIKLSLRGLSCSFICSPDFDTSHEPKVTKVIMIEANSIEPPRIIEYKNNFPVYHHKWLFVKDDYSGFNVEESKLRSDWVNNLPILKSNIGFSKQWKKILEKFGG